MRSGFHQGYARWAGQSAYPDLWRGLVAGWDPHFGAQGTKLFDLVRNVSHLTVNSPTASIFYPSARGVAFNLNGSSQYANGASNSYLQFLDAAWTVTGWCLLTAKSVGMAIVGKYGGGSAGLAEMVISYEVAQDQFRADFVTVPGDTNNFTFAAAYGSPPLNTWIHVAAWYYPGTLGITINGRFVNTSSITVPPVGTVSDFTIGRLAYAPFNYYWAGKIGQVLKYNRVLPQNELLQLATGASPFIRRRNVVGKGTVSSLHRLAVIG